MSLHKRTKTKINNLPVPVADSQPTVQSKRSVGCKRLCIRWLVRVIILGVVALIMVPVLIYWSQPRYFTVLVIGSDQRDNEHARSDVLMVVAIPKSAKDPFSMVMIPRDTKIDHPEKGLQKITHFYAMWEAADEYLGNKELTQSVVEDVLDITVDGSVEVTFDSFTEIVDMLGGVDTETYGHLDGAAAQEVVHNRFNKEGGDFGRADAQREILRNILSRVKDPVKAQTVYDYFLSTDRARFDINRLKLIRFGFAYMVGHKGDVSLGEVEEVVLPGEGQRIFTPDFNKELYYWVLDDAGTKTAVDQYLR